MKSLRELKPLMKLLKEEKVRLIFASIIIFLQGITEISTGYLNGKAVESITQMEIKKAIFYLLVYLTIEHFLTK